MAFKRNGKYYLNLPEFSAVISAMEGAGFEVSTIIEYVADELRGTGSHDIPGAIIRELEDACLNFIDNPMDTAIDVGIAYGKVRLMFKALGIGFDMIGFKKTISIGDKIRVKVAG